MSSNPILKKMKYLLRFVPDYAYIQLYYFSKFKRFANLKKPATLNEKINWLKLNDFKPEYADYVDKWKVKELVEKEIGAEYVIPLLGVWDHFDDIDFDSLPAQFVLKCNHDSEGIVIVEDKKTMNRDEAKKRIESALSTNFYYIGREKPYNYIKPKIIAEKYMVDSVDGELRDYKFFCFNGEPKFMYIATDRAIDQVKFDFFDMEFNHLNVRQHYPNAGSVRKPVTFEKMIELSRILSKNFTQVRVDFYEVNGKCYFGEMTFYSMSGFSPFDPPEWDYKFGEMLKLPDIHEERRS